MKVVKRSGKTEDLDIRKIVSSIEWASEDLSVSIEDIAKNANVQFRDMMSTSEIQNVLIKVTDDMSSLREPDYDAMSARLLMQKIYHEAFGGTRPLSLKSMIYKNIHSGNYLDFTEMYSDDEIEELCVRIDYNRNFNFSKAGLTILIDAYMISDTGSAIECPQTMFMAIAMDVFKNIKADRLKLVVAFYDALSTFKISLPTPMMKQLRTKFTDYASCIKIKSGDSAESWSLVMDSVMKHTMASAGVGIDASMVASIGDIVKNNTIVHSGKIPVYKVHDSIIQSSSQNGRRGSANEHTFFCDPEIETILALKSPKTETAKRIQDMKHAIKFNNFIYKLIENDETMYLMSPRKCKEMYENFHDSDKFEEMYNEHVKNKDYSGSINARLLAEKFIDARVETGVYYVFNADNANSSSPYKDTITQSNICCVTGDTKILTKEKGYVEISSVAGSEMECWNGEEWSMTKLFKASDEAEVYKVTLDNGVEITADAGHDWYIQKFSLQGKKRPVMDPLNGEHKVKTSKLVIGDSLVKFDLKQVPHGDKILLNAYENGFFSADGCDTGSSKHIDLYEDKMILYGRFCDYDSIISRSDILTGVKKTTIRYRNKNNRLKEKFFVPSLEYSVNSRLDWLAGFLDGDGTLTVNGSSGSESIQAVSTNKRFIESIMLMLQELGIHSRISDATEAGYRYLPKNDGSGESKEYWCKKTYRILIAGTELIKLLDMGYNASRVIPANVKYNRQSRRFARVVSVEKLEELQPTFCGSEPKRHKLMFNGALTGNCEITLPTKPLNPSRIDKPDIAVCILSGVNMAKTDISELEDIMKLLVWGLNEIIHEQTHPTPQASAFVRDYASLAVGLNSNAHYLAMNGIRFGSDKALELTYKYAEAMQYYGLKASMEYSRDFDASIPLFHKTTYANGVMPQDRAIKIDGCPEPEMDWESLRKDIVANGLANSTITAHMPGETSSMVGNQTSGLDPVRKPLTIKDRKSGSIKQYVPDVKKLIQYYDYAFDTKDLTERYIRTAAMIQQWNDQSISLSTYYNPDLYENGKVPLSQIWNDIKLANKLGMPTMYYNNTNISDAEQDEKEECVGCTL